MKPLYILISLLAMMLTATSVSFAQNNSETNVSEKQDLNTCLTRDLNAYFNASENKNVTVKFELLRKIPTQAGVATPKFYAWVKVFEKEVLKQHGAARIAETEDSSFEVTNFVTAEQIKADPSKIKTIFPAVLCPKIVELAKE